MGVVAGTVVDVYTQNDTVNNTTVYKSMQYGSQCILLCTVVRLTMSFMFFIFQISRSRIKQERVTRACYDLRIYHVHFVYLERPTSTVTAYSYRITVLIVNTRYRTTT